MKKSVDMSKYRQIAIVLGAPIVGFLNREMEDGKYARAIVFKDFSTGAIFNIADVDYDNTELHTNHVLFSFAKIALNRGYITEEQYDEYCQEGKYTSVKELNNRVNNLYSTIITHLADKKVKVTFEPNVYDTPIVYSTHLISDLNVSSGDVITSRVLSEVSVNGQHLRQLISGSISTETFKKLSYKEGKKNYTKALDRARFEEAISCVCKSVSPLQDDYKQVISDYEERLDKSLSTKL